MAVLNYVASDYASKMGLYERDVIEEIKNGRLDGYHENGYWYVKADLKSNDESQPFLTTVFYILAGLSLLGGLILCIAFWPSSSSQALMKSDAYSTSLAWLTAGIVEFAIFSAFGMGLKYLKLIYENTKNTLTRY